LVFIIVGGVMCLFEICGDWCGGVGIGGCGCERGCIVGGC